ncbi:CoA ester lyase (plasmid) [Limimaricola variabilis]|uniref:HpcH/HpaI aldolase/citrate lyase family protein n=1 Tax=Limimaricola variabilis TaxID=1492771 RepID=UPI002AC98F33|nr:CoA ester lyase [Limimaricola variabilis]WPY96397.1 CoA ester lyase [Limimaricola variabilis]
MVDVATIRTLLFVPANRPERFAKAAASGADAVILDLEDAVAREDKVMARAALDMRFTELPVIVRVNAIGTEWHDADLAAVCALGAAAVMLPKSETPETLAAVHRQLGGGMPILALIENARGLAQARAIATAEGVVRLAFGSIDYCADLGCAHLREVLQPARAELVLASRLTGIAAPVDGVTTDLSDPEITRLDAGHARDMGMTGKLCIHPRQVAPTASAFLPSEAECDWARRVLASGDGAVVIDGAMVDEPVRIRARTILAASGPS